MDESELLAVKKPIAAPIIATPTLVGEKKALTRGQWMVLAAAFLGWMFDGMELGLFPMVSRACLQDLLPKHVEGDVAVWTAGSWRAFSSAPRLAAWPSVGWATRSAAFGP
jgi:hypothetical protein